MTTFAMKGYKGKTVGVAISRSPLEIKGHFHLQGRQPVGDDGAPEWVYALLRDNPDIEVIAIGTKSSGKIYSR